MVPNQKGAGRPPKTDGKGKQIATTHVTLTIPVNLKEFIQSLPNANMSALFTRVVTMLYIGEVCRFCYGTNLRKLTGGLACESCSSLRNDGSMQWKYLEFNECSNCGVAYDNYNQPKWGGDPRRRGCHHPKCFEVEE